MNKRLNVTVVGSGAMGCLVGGLLAINKVNVTMIDVSEVVVNRIVEDGIKVTINNDTFIASVNAYTSCDQIKEKQDLIIFLVKGQYTQAAVTMNLPIIQKDTWVMTLQNGVGHVDVIKNILPDYNIIYGVLKIPAEIVDIGHTKTRVNKESEIVFGTSDGIIYPILERFSEVITVGMITGKATCNIDSHVWFKLRSSIKNVVFGITRITIGQMFEHREERDAIMNAITGELDAVVSKMGIEYPETDNETIAKVQVNASLYNHLPSTAQDFKYHRKTEVEYLNGAVSKAGKKLGVATPINDFVWNITKIMEKTYDQQF